MGGTGTGKTHIAIALGTTLINNGKKARFFNAVDLINALIKEQAEGNAGKIIRQLSALDCVIIDELGYIPFPKSGGALLFHLISKLYERTSVVITLVRIDCIARVNDSPCLLRDCPALLSTSMSSCIASMADESWR